ncbi:MAG: YncE family protein [Bacteroidota bacterium]
MKNIIIGISVMILLITSCKKNHEVNEIEKNINYPAAYIVNGEDASISVIQLSTNYLTETINLVDHTGTHSIMWPHHVFHHKNIDMHHLAIGVPGMDLSLGHTGGMPGHGGQFAIMDAVKGTISKIVTLPLMNHNAIYTPDGLEIWTSQMDMDGKVLVYDANTFVLKNTINVGMDPAEVTFSADGTKAYVCNGGDNSVTIINPSTKAIITTVSVGANPVGAWPSSIGKMFVDNEDGLSISVLDVATDAVVSTIHLGYKPGYAAYNSTTGELWVSNSTDGKVAYYLDMGSNIWMKHGEFVTGADAHAIAFYGNYAYVTNQGANTVSIINLTTHAKIKDVLVGKKPNGIAIKL